MTGLASQILDQAATRAPRVPRERPLLMSESMVRAERAGLKTESRRLRGLWDVNDQPGAWRFDRWQDGYPDGRTRAVLIHESGDPIGLLCPFGEAKDYLWIKETWAAPAVLDKLSPTEIFASDRRPSSIHYLADGPKPDGIGRTRVSIHMPREACRTVVQLVSVGLERLHDMSEACAKAEGVAPYLPDDARPGTMASYVVGFANLWNEINPGAPWALNFWVWRLRFRRVHPPTTERT